MNDKTETKAKKKYEPPSYYVSKTAEKVKEILDKYFKGYMSFGDSSFAITRGSTQVMIQIKHFLKDETIVVCLSNVVRGARIEQDLMHFLLRKNAELQFGAFALLFDGTVTFSHSIAGSNLDSNELITALSSVAFISDYYDDVITEIAGGKRASDYIESLKESDL